MGDRSRIAFELLLNIQWFLIGLNLILIAYDVVEYFHARLRRYLSYAVGRLGFVLMVGTIGVLLANSKTRTIEWSPELIAWITGIVLMGQGIVTRIWEIRQDRKARK